MMTGQELLAFLQQLRPEDLALPVFSICDHAEVRFASVERQPSAVDPPHDLLMLE